MGNFTFEEINLMCIYNTGSHTGLIDSLREMRGELAPEETELRELTDSALCKLQTMTDDEFANIGQIPQFEKLIATIRSRDISASIILQSKSQLKALYKDNASTIEGNCDTTLFLGGKEKDTLKDLAEILGKETIDLYNTSDTRGMSQSYGLNYQKTGKDMPYLFVESSVALNFT